MNQEDLRWANTEAIFHEALDAREPERSAILTSRCAGDTTLMAELRSLLAACEAEETHRNSVSTECVDRGTAVGPYVIDALIGRGGMGAVYRAHRADGQFEQQVAIKIVDMPLASEFFRERFRAERQMLASLSHPFIAHLLDGGVTESGELYLVMEFIDGVSITEFCAQRKLNLEDRLRLFLKVCSAVGYAHRNLIVHRDLKPENILVIADATPRLLDFGTAKIMQPLQLSDNATQPGLQTFTPRYASPEQVLGRPISISTDIYSLGILLFVLLTDSHPYDLADFSTEELLRVICEQVPRRPSLAGSPHGTIDADLDSIILKALRKEPGERYPTVEHLAADIQAYLDHRPVEARRGNSRYLAAKFIQRNKLALAAASLLLVTLIAGVAGVLWQSHRANEERMKADARSTEMRELTTGLLAEIDSAVKGVPGSTPVQKTLVSRVLEHLDQLSREAGDDPVLAVDMLNAYTRLGDLEGNPYKRNLGDHIGALASLDKGLSCASVLHVSTTDDPAVLEAYGFAELSRSQVLNELGRDAESAAAMQSSLRAFDTLAARSNATSDEIAMTASAYNALANGRNLAGQDDPDDGQSSIAAWRHGLTLAERELKMDPRHEKGLHAIALIASKIGATIVVSDPAEAVVQLRRSVATWKSLPAAEQELESTRLEEAFGYNWLANALAGMADYAAALDACDEALKRVEPIAASDPKDTKATFYLAGILLTKAHVYELMLNPAIYPNRREDSDHRRQALALLRRTIPLWDRLASVDRGDSTWIAEQAEARARLGTLEYGTAQRKHGELLAKTALTTLRSASNKPNAPLVMLFFAVSDSLSAMPLTLRDPPWTLGAAQRLNDRTHPKKLAYLLLLAQAYRAIGDTASAAETAREALKLLAPVPVGVNKSITQTMLELEATGVDSNR